MDTLAQIQGAVSDLVGESVKRPPGTLSGHAAGLPFEKLVHSRLVKALPERTFRHFELLNMVFEAHPECVTSDDRRKLLGSPELQFLLQRGDAATEAWSVENPFVEKQNDTAETVILPKKGWRVETQNGEPVTLVDVKTQNTSLKAQPPNIISAKKLVKACRLAIDHKTEQPFDFVYVGVKWLEKSDLLICRDVCVVSLMRARPSDLYINWAAATQIQFQPSELDQTYTLSALEWCRGFIETYTSQLERRQEKVLAEIKDLRKFLDSH